jgi:hypothetical protein
MRTQRRRQLREQEAHMQPALNEPDSDAWTQIAPLLDEALSCLGEREHDAVVLRFFDGKELKQVGAATGTTEDAARMRVNRGLEKLRKYFNSRRVTLSTTTIASALAANSVQAAPPALIPVVTKGAIAAVTIPASTLAGTKILTLFTLQKAMTGAVMILLFWATGSAIFKWPPLYHYTGEPLYPCMDGLLHVEGGKRKWAMETGQTNGTIVDPVEFERYTRTKGGLRPNYPMPHCQSRGIYNYGKVGQLPTCSLATNASSAPVKERVGLFGWRWKVAPSTPESHILTQDYIEKHLAAPELMQRQQRQ